MLFGYNKKNDVWKIISQSVCIFNALVIIYLLHGMMYCNSYTNNKTQKVHFYQ